MSDPDPVAHSPGNIPFSWEKKAGVSKASYGESVTRDHQHELLQNLPPPPCTTEGGTKINVSAQDFQIPLPPCASQPPFYRTSSKKGLRMQDVDDPFFAAYKECTKTRKSTDCISISKSVLRKSMSIFSCSCKRSCAVRDNNLVSISHVSQNVDKD